MIQTLRIEKNAPGEYTVRVLNAHSEALDFQTGSIASALRDVTVMMPKASAFHVWFEHVSIGTTPTSHLRHDSESLANRLKLLHGQYR